MKRLIPILSLLLLLLCCKFALQPVSAKEQRSEKSNWIRDSIMLMPFGEKKVIPVHKKLASLKVQSTQTIASYSSVLQDTREAFFRRDENEKTAVFN